MKFSPAEAIAEIGASSPGPGVGAFFDLTAHWSKVSRPRFMSATESGGGRPGSASCWACSKPRSGTSSAAWSSSA